MALISVGFELRCSATALVGSIDKPVHLNSLLNTYSSACTLLSAYGILRSYFAMLQARLADRDLAIESGYALAKLASLTHDRIILDGGSGDGDGGSFLDESDRLRAIGSTPGSSIPLDRKRR